jgi:signal transduction histidine kinase
VFPIRGADGAFRPFLTRVVPTFDSNGKVVRWFGTNTDISEQQKAALALQEANSNLEMRVNKRTSELEARNSEALVQSKRLQELSAHLMRAQDDERRRISRELHDSLGQYLAHAKMHAESLRRSDATEKETQSLSHLVDTLDKCLTETRTISHLLHPPLLDEMGFSPAAKWYVDAFSERSGIKVNLNTSHELKRLPDTVELALFRILQESLTNIHRHSHSQSAEIQVELRTDDIMLQVKDYGEGIPPELLERLRSNGGSGIGFRSMRERIIELGGRFEIESDKNGTLIRVTAPLRDISHKTAIVHRKPAGV